MEMSKVYDTNAEAFFTILMNAFKADYQDNTKKALKDKDIQAGLTYKKYFGKDKQNSALIKVRAMEFPTHYKVELTSNRGSNIIEYVVVSRSEDEIQVTYREEYTDTGVFTKLNNKLLYPFFKKSMTKRMEAQVDNLVRHSKVRKGRA